LTPLLPPIHNSSYFSKKVILPTTTTTPPPPPFQSQYLHSQSTNASIKKNLEYTLKSTKFNTLCRNAKLKFEILGLICVYRSAQFPE